MGVKLEIIEKGGAWFTVNGQRIQGRDGVKEYLKNNPEVCEEIEKQIRENADKLTPRGRKAAAVQPAVKPVDISASDFEE